MAIEELKAEASKGLADTYGAEPTVVAAAPGRVNLIGEHIDYCDGFVLPFALENNFVIAAAPNGTKTVRLASSAVDGVVEVDVSGDIPEAEPKWANYPRGVMQFFREETGAELPGFDAYIVSNVPAGGGLSSSAAFELAVANLLQGLTGTHINTKAAALLCQRAEHKYAHVPCGIMDQFASAFGEDNRLVLIDCQSGEPTLVPFENPDLTVIIANTRVNHELSDGSYAARRKDTEDGLAAVGKASWRDVSAADVEAAKEVMGDRVYRRGRHVVGEIQRTKDAADALGKNEFDRLGELMYASHDSLRDDFEVSCDELDVMVDIARGLGREQGVIGSRMTGGGFGGSTVTLCESRHADDVMRHMAEQYKAKTGIDAQIFASRPSRGARVL